MTRPVCRPSECWQEHVPSLSGGSEGDTFFIWQFQQRDTHVWSHSLSAERLHRECFEGDFTPALREGP